MSKLLFKRPDGGVSIVIPAPKKDLIKVLGPLTDEEYWNHVIERSIPAGVEFRVIQDSDLPASREFRNAWVDSTPETKIDICCEKAKHMAIEQLRQRRNEALAKTDIELTRAVEESQDLTPVREKRNALRDATEGLKAIPTAGILNDEATLEAIRAERDKPL